MDFVLGKLEVYRLALNLSRESWKIYSNLNWQDKKVIGDQFIRSIDSVGSNIAEGYGRYHFKDKVKFYYNSRGSLLEAKHWILLLYERGKIDKDCFTNKIKEFESIHTKLNAFISHTLSQADNHKSKY